MFICVVKGPKYSKFFVKTELFTLWHGVKTVLFRSENITVIINVSIYANINIKTALYASPVLSAKSKTLLYLSQKQWTALYTSSDMSVLS